MAVEPATFEVVGVRDAGGALRDDVRAVRVVVRRELIRFWRSKARSISSFVQPLLFLFVLGTGLARSIDPGTTGGVDFRTFLYPGIIAMTVLFTAVFSAMSIVWDREFGFLREMLVAPVSRVALVVGKCVGGALVAAAQAIVMLAMAGVVGVPYEPLLMLQLALLMLLTAFVLTAVGVLFATFIQHMETFPLVMQFGVLPLFFLSGAIYPVDRLPNALAFFVALDPVTYAVDPMRRLVFAAVGAETSSGLTWNGWLLPIWFEVLVFAAFGLLVLAVASRRFGRQEP